MDLNRFSYYRANPFANNDFIPVASMNNRKPKQFISQIPQGDEHYPSKTGKRIFKDRIDSDQILRDNILNSPQRYPYENRIAFDKGYSRNLDTIDIEGASSGTKVSQSIRNKHKALQQLRRKNNQQHAKNTTAWQSLDQVYQKQRRQLAQKMQRNIETRKTKQVFPNNNSNQLIQPMAQDILSSTENLNSSKMGKRQMQAQYQRYVSHNSNKKYQGIPNAYEYEGFQRYKRPQNPFQTIGQYKNGQINQQPQKRQNNLSRNQRYQSLDHDNQNGKKNQTNVRGSSRQQNPAGQDFNRQSSQPYVNNSYININNRHRSNPEYVQNYSTQLQKRINEKEWSKQIQDGLKNKYQQDRLQLRRNNPTNLSFSVAAKSSLMGPIM